jgi:hypothetical protein
MRTAHLLAALPLTCLFAGAAFGQACNKPLALRSEIQMESSNGGPSAIPVKINGTDQKLTLATAGTTTQLNETAVKAMKLETQRSDLMLPDFRGMPQHVDEVTIADFAMPGLHGTNLKWPVSPGGGRGGRGGDSSDSGPAGLFSLNYMMVYDIDADFGSDKLRIFNQDHCPGAVMYWKAPGAVGVAPITIDNGHVTVPVTVNGKALTAVIDTAARDSRLYSAVADHVLGLDPTTTKKFDAAVAIGPLALNDVSINVVPDINAGEGAGAQGVRARASAIQAELARPEVTLGMDVLRKLHLYMAFGEKKLYVTGTTSTLPAAAKTP